MASRSMPDINSLYAGRTIFLTGGSGFVGKVVIEKFLRNVPDVKKIFMLVRSAKGKNAAQRWAEISKTVLYNRVRLENPEAFAKIVPVEGDISMDDMGLSPENLQAVLNETSVVIHCAATVRFNDKLRSAIELNIRGVNRIIGICKRMPNLRSFLHCSTAYVNVDKEGDVQERQYPVACDPYQLLEAPDWMSDEMLEGLTNGVISKYFNTYCFTKHVAEELVRRECADLPTLIFRPSIIAGIWQDGIPGWADAFQGVTACALGFGTGTVPRMPCDASVPLDVIPVDCVSSMIIACAAYRLFLTDMGDRSMPIFHCNSSHLNPLLVSEFRDYCGSFFSQYPLEKILFKPTTGTRGDYQLEDTFHAFKEHVVGPGLDKIGEMMGKKPFWARTFGKVREIYHVFMPFIMKRWVWKTDNMVELLDMMQSKDVETFDFDIRKVNWEEYSADVLFGMKYFLTKNDMSDEKIAQLRRRDFKYQVAEFSFIILLSWLLCAAVTGSFSSVLLTIFLATILFYTLNLGMCSPAKIYPIDRYRATLKRTLMEDKIEENNNNTKA